MRRFVPLLVLASLSAFFTFGPAGDALHAQSLGTALVQGPRGMTPLEYAALSREARGRFERQEWAPAAEAYARLTAAYPWDGETWRRLGVARYRTGDYRHAAPAFARADALGVSPYPTTNAALAALAYARVGEPDSALAWLERTVLVHRSEVTRALLRDSAFHALRSHPRFLALAPPPADSTAPRARGWSADVDYLLASLRRFRPEYAGGRPLPDSIVRAAARIKERVPALTDAQVAVELQKLVSLVGRSHTGVGFGGALPARLGRTGALPLVFHLFPEGVLIVNADSARRELMGARVVAVDGTPVERVLRAAEPLVQADEGDSFRWAGMEVLRTPHVLHALGIAREPGRVRLRVEDAAGRAREVEVASSEAVVRAFLPPPAAPAPPPLSLSRPDAWYWFEPLAADSAVYVNFGRTFPQEGAESIADFALRLRRWLAEHPGVRSVVVDVRRNTGGNTYLYPELLRTLIAFDAREGARLFVLVGRNTGSAAMNFVVDLDRLTGAVFVGEATGAQPRQHGDPVDLVLPYSGLPVFLSTVEWSLTSPRDARRWIAPDVPVVLTADDYRANRDPVMETVLGLIRTGSDSES